VGNPSLRPAFRVRRGSYRKYGFVSGRARRATRPTPSEFRRPVGRAPTSAAGSVSPSTLPPASPCALPLAAAELGEHARSRAGTPTGPTGTGRGAQGRDRKQNRRARSYDKAYQAHDCIQPVPGVCRAARAWAVGRKSGRTGVGPNPIIARTKLSDSVGGLVSFAGTHAIGGLAPISDIPTATIGRLKSSRTITGSE
jgi:hypothetical protein